MILYVSDGTGEAAFLGFDTEMSKLTHVLASEAAQIVVCTAIALCVSTAFCSWQLMFLM